MKTEPVFGHESGTEAGQAVLRFFAGIGLEARRAFDEGSGGEYGALRARRDGRVRGLANLSNGGGSISLFKEVAGHE